jgi:hypothetical protein
MQKKKKKLTFLSLTQRACSRCGPTYHPHYKPTHTGVDSVLYVESKNSHFEATFLPALSAHSWHSVPEPLFQTDSYRVVPLGYLNLFTAVRVSGDDPHSPGPLLPSHSSYRKRVDENAFGIISPRVSTHPGQRLSWVFCSFPTLHRKGGQLTYLQTKRPQKRVSGWIARSPVTYNPFQGGDQRRG